MNFQRFDKWKPKPDTLALIQYALEAYEDMREFEPTLRTIYYQLVAHEDKPILNKQSEYKRLGAILTRARNAGLFPWDALQDKGREAQSHYIQEDPEEVLSGIQYHLSLDYWADQEHYVEVWVEKQAQEGVVKHVCEQYEVPWLSCKGYISATAAYDAGRRFEAAAEEGKQTVLIHLGDHDPSGIDMTRDNGDRVEKYGSFGGLFNDVRVIVDRPALNMDQIEEHNLPPDPAKMTDSRADAYIERFGTDSWELDAIKPQILKPIIDRTIRKYMDMPKFRDTVEREEDLRTKLEWISNNADETLSFAADQIQLEDE